MEFMATRSCSLRVAEESGYALIKLWNSWVRNVQVATGTRYGGG